jgi:hypothetical protein
MFQVIQESAKKPPKEALLQLWRSPWFRYTMAILLFAGAAGGAYSYYLWMQALSEDCDRHEPPKIAVSELIDMKERLARYQHDRSEEAYLSLSADELGFVIYTKTDILGRYEFTPEGLAAQVTVPRGDGTCYNIDFVGLLDTDRGSIEVRPVRLVVGELDLTSWFQPSYTIEASSFGAAAEETFANISSITITSTEAQIRLRNRAKIW